MDGNELIKEASYFVSMDFAKQMLDQDLISKKIYNDFKQMMVEKYSPALEKLNTNNA